LADLVCACSCNDLLALCRRKAFVDRRSECAVIRAGPGAAIGPVSVGCLHVGRADGERAMGVLAAQAPRVLVFDAARLTAETVQCAELKPRKYRARVLDRVAL